MTVCQGPHHKPRNDPRVPTFTLFVAVGHCPLHAKYGPHYIGMVHIRKVSWRPHT